MLVLCGGMVLVGVTNQGSVLGDAHVSTQLSSCALNMLNSQNIMCHDAISFIWSVGLIGRVVSTSTTTVFKLDH